MGSLIITTNIKLTPRLEMRNKKRLSQEYMELLKRNQGSINKVESVVESIETVLADCEDEEIEVKKINETEEADTIIVLEEENELASSDENNLQVISLQEKEEEAHSYVPEINDNERDQKEHNEPDDNIVIEKHL